MKQQKFTRTIRELGDSLIISIDRDVVKELNLKKGDTILVIVSDKIDTDISIKSYRCKKCQHQFDMEETDPYCTACGNEDVERRYG